MKTKLLFFCILLFSTMISAAEDNSVNLIIRHTDDKLTSFKLDEIPVIKLSAEDLAITTQTGSFGYPLSIIKQIYYENVTEGIDNVTIDGISISQRENLIVINGLAQGKTATLFNIDGKQLLSSTSTGANPVIISIDNLPGGTYVIKADYATFKTLKR